MFSDPFIIAEIGHNHMGQVDVCKDLFREAARCGVNAVKLQKRDNRSLYTKTFFDLPYVNSNSYGATYGLHREALEFGMPEYVELKAYAESLGLIFFATPFDIKSADFLRELNIPLYKIASADLTNIPLIRHVVSMGKPVIISTGGGSWEDIDRVYGEVDAAKTVFLHCVASYPNQAENMNLKIIPAMRARYPGLAAVGLSDHYNGIAMAEAAYVLGGTVIEKHFTLNHTWRGTDHPLSLEPQGMESLVKNIHRIKSAMGGDNKRVLTCERNAIYKMGKSIYARRNIAAGEIFTEDNICLKSPAGGLPPYVLHTLLGRSSARGILEDEVISFSDTRAEGVVN